MDTRALILMLAACRTPAAGSTADAPYDVSVPGPLPPNLVAWFTFDGTINDVENRATMVFGGPFTDAITVNGYHGHGFYLNGTNQFGLIDTRNTQLNFSGPFTIAAWVRVQDVPADYAVIASRSFAAGDATSFTFGIDSTLRLRSNDLVTASKVPFDTWTHVAFVFDGRANFLYINGVIRGSESAFAPMWDNHIYIDVGAQEDTNPSIATHHFEGVMDDLMFFNRALDPQELVMLSE